MRRRFFPAMLAALVSQFEGDVDPPKEVKYELNAKHAYFLARGEYHPRKHTKSSYRAQQRAAKKRRSK